MSGYNLLVGEPPFGQRRIAEEKTLSTLPRPSVRAEASRSRFSQEIRRRFRGSDNCSAGEKCAMWRIVASLFGPETTPMRHQCVTVLGQNDAGILRTANNPDFYSRLSEARQCTEVTHGVHFARKGRGSRRTNPGLSLCGTYHLPPGPQAWRHAAVLRPIAKTRACRKSLWGCHPRTPTIDLARGDCRSRLVDEHLMLRPPGRSEKPPPFYGVAGRALSTIRDPVKPRLTRP